MFRESLRQVTSIWLPTPKPTELVEKQFGLRKDAHLRLPQSYENAYLYAWKRVELVISKLDEPYESDKHLADIAAYFLLTRWTFSFFIQLKKSGTTIEHFAEDILIRTNYGIKKWTQETFGGSTSDSENALDCANNVADLIYKLCLSQHTQQELEPLTVELLINRRAFKAFLSAGQEAQKG